MEVRRYCGHCLREVESGQTRCSSCDHLLPTTYTRRSTPSARTVAVSSGEAASSGDTASDRISDQTSVIPLAALDETIVRIQSSHVDDGGVGWSEGQIVAERFRIVRCIGQGGMGKVYLARDESLDRLMALKRVPQEIVYDGDARDELREETNRLLDLAHENIIRVHTYYDEPTWPFFAMEYLEGPTLKALLRDRKHQGRCFEVEELTIIARQVSKGLAYAHAKKLIHRDLKPANVMLARPAAKVIDDSVLVKITDFGISRVVADSTLRQTGRRSGTLPYMSPEQFRGEECTVRSDVYSLAATYYELLSGRPPFCTGEIGHQIMNEEPRAIVGLSNEINETLSRALAKDPDERFTDVDEFATALEERNPYPTRVAVPVFWKKLRKKLKPAVVALLGFLFLFLTYDFVHRRVVTRPGNNSVLSSNPPTRGGRVETAELYRILQHQLDTLIEDRIPSSSLVFRLEREGELRRSRSVFHSIYFKLQNRSSGETRELRGTTVRGPDKEEDSRFLEFSVNQLEEALYVLEPGIWPEARVEHGLPHKLPVRKSFVVDLTGPEFQIEPIDKSKFSLVKPALLATFGDTCELRLLSPGKPGDIHEAFFYPVRPGRMGEQMKIADPGRWKIELPERQNHFRVIARDELGNPEERVIQIDKLDLAVRDLQADHDEAMRGNTVVIRGVLRVADFYEPPDLVFFVNGQPVQDLGEDYGVPSLETSSFRARLELPSHTNTVEIRYELGSDTVPFAPPARISGIRVGPPRIRVKVPKSTAETHVTFKGTLAPSFEGLVLSLDHSNVSQYELALSADPMHPGGARFDREIELVPNRRNELRLTCTYDGEVLEEAGDTFSVYCDTQLPELPDGVIFDPFGANIRVRIKPSEPLAKIRIRREGSFEWVPLMKDPLETYTYSTRIPDRPTIFEIEMTDLVGNVAKPRVQCDLFLPREVVGEEDERANGVVEATPGISTGAGRAEPASVTIESECKVLRELGMRFHPFGQKDGRRMEMAETEITLGAWNRFLTAHGLSKLPGDPKLPWSVGDSKFDESLVDGFLRWLESNCDGGYDFFVPNSDEWLLAFAGASTVVEARRELRIWFLSLGSHRFHEIMSGPNRYEVDTLLAVGSRPVNRTPTGLLDMESNVQEIVLENGGWFVIGGYNGMNSEELHGRCQRAKLLEKSRSVGEGRMTGLRVARRKQSKQK